MNKTLVRWQKGAREERDNGESLKMLKHELQDAKNKLSGDYLYLIVFLTLIFSLVDSLVLLFYLLFLFIHSVSFSFFCQFLIYNNVY